MKGTLFSNRLQSLEALCIAFDTPATGYTDYGECRPGMMNDVTRPCQCCDGHVSGDGSTSGSVSVSKMQPVTEFSNSDTKWN